MDRDKLIEAKIYSLQMANGQIDMKVGGEEFRHLANMLYQTFKQNGGKNFFTTSFGFDRDSDHYEMTIQKINGLGMAEKLSAETHRADVAEEALKLACEKAYDIRVSMDTLSCSSCWLFEEHGMCYTHDKFEAGSECYDKWQEHFIQQAEARLKELEAQNDNN